MHPGISAFSATLKSIDYNVAMTFILTNKINNNNNNNNNNFPLGKIYCGSGNLYQKITNFDDLGGSKSTFLNR